MKAIRRALALAALAAASLDCNLVFGIDEGEARPASSIERPDGGGGQPPGTARIPHGSFAFAPGVNATLDRDIDADTDEVTLGRFDAWVTANQPAPCTGAPCTLDPGGPYQATMQWNPSWNSLVAGTGYLDVEGCSMAGDSSTGLPTDILDGDPRLPINCVNWYQAVAFCYWDGGKRLLTETEWQYEASGRGEGFTYPWGNTKPTGCDQTIWRNGAGPPDYNGCDFPVDAESTPKGVSRDGLWDMGGSVWEWTWDLDGDYPANGTTNYSGPAPDPSAPPGAIRSDRGGSYTWDEPALHSSHRDATPADAVYADIGIRCARTAP